MARETSMRSRVNHALRPLDAIAVENMVGPGTPDVNYIGGWIELKSLDRWPTKADTVVRVEHFTPEQRAWHRRRCRRGGNSWVLLRVGNEWLLFAGNIAADILGNVPRALLLKAARIHWRKTPTDAELLTAFDKQRV